MIRPLSPPFPAAGRRGFTLVEILVSILVLVLLIAMVTQMVNSTALTSSNSLRRLDADSQARLIFDRMGNDFGHMLKRPDVDCIFYKNQASNSGSNDAMFFYSQSPAYYDSPTASTSQDPVALVGYRITSTNPYYPNIPVLERLGKGLTWDGASSGNASGGVMFLTFSGSATPLTTSLLDTNWPNIGTPAQAYLDGTDGDYHALSDLAFRMETAFLLTDGSTSLIPVTNPSAYKNTLNASAPPTVTSGTTSGYAPGSRWFDTSVGGRGYICTNATAGAAVWNPIGVQDISAIIVTLALLNREGRKLVGNMNSLIPALPDVMPGDLNVYPLNLMEQNWTQAVVSGSFAASSRILPAVGEQVRIYQRYFYVNPRKE